MLREDSAYAEKAARISAITKDITELMTEIGLKPAVAVPDLVVAYHSACSMQHGQAIRLQPKQLLSAAGFIVKDVPEGHLCCGSAGTYNLLQPAIATRLRDAQGREHRAAAPGSDRDRQHRLHHPDRGRHPDPDRAYRSPARLGDRRTGAQGARGAGGRRAPRRGTRPCPKPRIEPTPPAASTGRKTVMAADAKLNGDIDPAETHEWLESIDSVLAFEGTDRLRFLLEQVVERAHEAGTDLPFTANTAYVNTIPLVAAGQGARRLPSGMAQPLLHPLERARDRGARQQAHQRRRPHRELRVLGHALRRRLQPLLARAVGGPRRRPGLHPGPLRARDLRAGLSRGPDLGAASSTTSARRPAARACPPTRTPG